MMKNAADPGAPDARALAVLVSGGIDSAALLAESARRGPAQPLYFRFGLFWEQAELLHLRRLLDAIASPSLRPLAVLDVPVGDLYEGGHWSLTGVGVPAAGTPDEAVFLPGRNVLFLAKAMLWCHLRGVPALALAPLEANPFPDATPEFFAAFAAAVNRGISGSVEVRLPYRGLHKADVLRRAAAAGLPPGLTFSCVRPVHNGHCGACNKCDERRAGFREAGIADPTTYHHHSSPCEG
jgi:7-cyano-7-deazaguanine synthase